MHQWKSEMIFVFIFSTNQSHICCCISISCHYFVVNSWKFNKIFASCALYTHIQLSLASKFFTSSILPFVPFVPSTGLLESVQHHFTLPTCVCMLLTNFSNTATTCRCCNNTHIVTCIQWHNAATKLRPVRNLFLIFPLNFSSTHLSVFPMEFSFSTLARTFGEIKTNLLLKRFFLRPICFVALYCCCMCVVLLRFFIALTVLLLFVYSSHRLLAFYGQPSAKKKTKTQKKLFLLFLCTVLLLLISCKQCVLRQLSQIVSSQRTSQRRQTNCLVDRLNVKWRTDGQLVSQASCEQVF